MTFSRLQMLELTEMKYTPRLSPMLSPYTIFLSAMHFVYKQRVAMRRRSRWQNIGLCVLLWVRFPYYYFFVVWNILTKIKWTKTNRVSPGRIYRFIGFGRKVFDFCTRSNTLRFKSNLEFDEVTKQSEFFLY